MNLVALFDLIAFFGFAGAVVVSVAFAARATPAPKMNYTAAALIMLAMLSAAFVMFSNFIEHLGVTASLDTVEDFVGILFLPLLAYAYYLIWVDQRMAALKSAVGAAQAEHEMLMNILDSIHAAVVLIDPGGRITFANEYARTILELPLGANESYMTGYGSIVPSGAEANLGPDITFDLSALGRTIDSEQWDYVVGDVRTTLGVSGDSLSEDLAAGSVITFMPVASMRTWDTGEDHGS